jgi:hypothetical protein
MYTLSERQRQNNVYLIKTQPCWHSLLCPVSKLEAAPGDLSCLLNPLYGVLAAIVDNVCVEAHELLTAALLVALEVVAAGALVGVHGMSLADTVRYVGTLTKGHWEG